jgi:hypothetical protein
LLPVFRILHNGLKASGPFSHVHLAHLSVKGYRLGGNRLIIELQAGAAVARA